MAAVKKKKKRKLRKSIKYTLIILILLLVGTISISFFYKNLVFLGEKSANSGAEKYMTNTCLAFYPSDAKKGKEVARNICKDVSEKTVFDYSVRTLGEYKVYSYNNDISYLVDKDGKTPKVEENISEKGQMIISDYLRYTMKKNNLDYAYTTAFLEETYYPTITSDRYSYGFDGDNFVAKFAEYETEVKIPIDVIGAELGMNIGETKEYKKPVYINPNRPSVALTFDDGPSLNENCTTKLINELYKYDSQATFYCVGGNLGPNTKPILADGISKGMQYGSHSLSHPNLKGVSSEEANRQIMSIADWFKEELNYDMTTYRPPFGAYNEQVDAAIPLPAILWEIDTEDWASHDPQLIHDITLENAFDTAVILMHDIHEDTITACVDYNIIKDLIDAGYQLVTIDDVATLRGVTLQQGTHLCWGD